MPDTAIDVIADVIVVLVMAILVKDWRCEVGQDLKGVMENNWSA